MCNDMSLRFRRQQFFYKIFEGIPLPTVVKPSTFQAQRWVLSMTLSSPLGKMGPTKAVTVASSSSLERDLTVKGSRAISSAIPSLLTFATQVLQNSKAITSKYLSG